MKIAVSITNHEVNDLEEKSLNFSKVSKLKMKLTLTHTDKMSKFLFSQILQQEVIEMKVIEPT